MIKFAVALLGSTALALAPIASADAQTLPPLGPPAVSISTTSLAVCNIGTLSAPIWGACKYNPFASAGTVGFNGLSIPASQITGLAAVATSGNAADVVSPGNISGGVVRSLASRVTDLPIVPEDFCPTSGCLSDMTAAVQSAFNTGVATGRFVKIDKVYNVTTILANSGLKVQGVGTLVGTSTSATASVLEIKASSFLVQGKLTVNANFDTNYSEGVLWHHTGQYSVIRGLDVTSAPVCWQIGSTDEPSSLMSELTILGGSTFGCPTAAKIIGTETYVSVVGAVWSGDNFGVPSGQATAWNALPFRGIVSIGANVSFVGGELLLTAVPNPNGNFLIEDQPLAGSGNEGTIWGRIRLSHVTTETASPLATTTNPSNLTISSNYAVRGLLQFEGCTGYHSQDLAPFISTNASYDGEIIVRGNSWWHSGAVRTNSNITAGSTLTDIYTDDRGFGPGFKPDFSGIVGGTLHFTKRPILNVSGLNGQVFPANAATTALYTTADQTGDLARFTSMYNASTGIFTVPPGGLKSVSIRARAQFSTAVNVNMYIVNAGNIIVIGGSMSTPGGSVGQVSVDLSTLLAGQQIKLLLGTPGGASATATNPDGGNEFEIEAAN